TIYHSNAHLIGRIKDCDLAEAIVVCYNKCKKVVDGFKYNNDLFQDYRQLADQISSMQPGELQREAIVKPLLKTKYQALADYARIIKEDHFEVKGYVEKLLKILNGKNSSD